MTTLDQTTYRLSDLTTHSAQLPVVSKLAITIAYKVSVWNRLARTRRTLACLTNAELADIGLTPRQAHTEANKRFWRQ
jgi:uncharacterized protein YjiS (DUF1127 family)